LGSRFSVYRRYEHIIISRLYDVCEGAADTRDDVLEGTQLDTWWQRTNWGTDAALSTWYGIEVNGDGRVVKLNLGENNLRGTVVFLDTRRTLLVALLRRLRPPKNSFTRFEFVAAGYVNEHVICHQMLPCHQSLTAVWAGLLDRPTPRELIESPEVNRDRTWAMQS